MCVDGMAQECYFKWCYWHSKDEPICYLETCKAGDKELKYFKILRKEEVDLWVQRLAKESAEEYYDEIYSK
jgi:hypothetical protein